MQDIILTFFTRTLGLADPLFWIAMACAFGLGKARQPPFYALLLAFGMAILVILLNWQNWQRFYGDQASAQAMAVLLTGLFLRGPVLLVCWRIGKFLRVT